MAPFEWMQNLSARRPEDEKAQQDPQFPWSSIGPIQLGLLSRQLNSLISLLIEGSEVSSLVGASITKISSSFSSK